MKILRWWWLAGAISLAGCVDVEEHVTVNPDGSGKITIQRKRTLVAVFSDGEGQTDVDEQARSQIRRMIEKATEVEAWKDIRYEVDEDMVLTVVATAYFRDFTRYRTDDDFGWRMKRKDGNLIFTLRDQPEDGESVEPFELTDEDALEQVKQERAQARQAQPLVDAICKDLRFATTLRVAASPLEVTSLQKTEDGRYSFEMTGRDLLAAHQAFLERDDAWWVEQLQKAARQGQKEIPRTVYLEQLFGSADPPTVEAPATGQPLFDYQAEVDEAKAGHARLKKELGIEDLKLPGDR